jgi:hypothetical protein
MTAQVFIQRMNCSTGSNEINATINILVPSPGHISAYTPLNICDHTGWLKCILS